jgi:hypothetical protein
MRTNVFDSSVQRASFSGEPRRSFVYRFSQYDPIIPRYWSPERDRFLRDFWKSEGTLSSAIYSVASRNAAFGWELFGSKDEVEASQQLLQAADFGGGWQQLITKITEDYLTMDNGAFMEVIRPAKVNVNGKPYPVLTDMFSKVDTNGLYVDGGKTIEFSTKEYDVYDSPLDLPIGIAHLDSGRVTRTGNRDIPYVYRDTDGYEHKLRWWQVVDFVDMPSTDTEMNGVGFCAVSRAFRFAHIAQSMSIYKDEKLSGKFNRAIHITNADPDVLNDQIMEAQRYGDNQGLVRYTQPVVATTFDPTTIPSVATIDLAGVPDGFTEEGTMNWYIAILALALGVDYSFLAPLPGKGLGTASQSETMARQARGKSSRLFMDMIMSALNFRGILPPSVQFRFVERDTQQEMEEENVKQSRAKTRQIMIANGEISPQIARQIANDDGDLSGRYLEAMGEEDIVPGITAQGDVSVEAVDEATSKKSKGARKRILRIDDNAIQQRKQQLLYKKSLAERDENEEGEAVEEKKLEIEDLENEELRQALGVYHDEFVDLVERAPSMDPGEFEELMNSLIALTIVAVFAIFAEMGRDDFNEDVYGYLEEVVTWNLDSVPGLSEKVYRADGYLPESVIALWVGSMSSVAFKAMLMNPNKQDRKLMWELGNTEHCATCMALDGQVHTAAEWFDSGFSPQCTTCGLLCGGWRCGCAFVEVSSNYPERGSFASVPTA